jgi:dTDP-4-amino-4,6-dideoxygalactose transaminase
MQEYNKIDNGSGRDEQWLAFDSSTWTFPDLIHAHLTALGGDKTYPQLIDIISQQFGVEHVLPTNLGRTAILLGLKALGFGSGEGVLVPSMVCPTVIRAIIRAGCRPILVDVEDDLHLSVRTLNEAYEHGACAVLAPHLYGLSAPIEDIESWAKKREMKIIDDAAQAAGITRGDEFLGSYGNLGVFSFGPFKSIGVLRGGALVSSSQELIYRASKIFMPVERPWETISRTLSGSFKVGFRSVYLTAKRFSNSPSVTGMPTGWNVNALELGDKPCHLSHFDSELIRCALNKSAENLERRRKTARQVWQSIQNFEEMQFIGPPDAPYVKIPIRLKKGLSPQNAVNALRSLRIEAERTYTPIHLQEHTKHLTLQSLKGAEECWKHTILVPNPVKAKNGIIRLVAGMMQLRILKG